jgi:hypothetical protein
MQTGKLIPNDPARRMVFLSFKNLPNIHFAQPLIQIAQNKA